MELKLAHMLEYTAMHVDSCYGDQIAVLADEHLLIPTAVRFFQQNAAPSAPAAVRSNHRPIPRPVPQQRHYGVIQSCAHDLAEFTFASRSSTVFLDDLHMTILRK